MKVTEDGFPSIKSIIKEIKNDKGGAPFTDERVRRIVNNSDIKMGMDLYTKAVRETWMIRGGVTVGIVTFLACMPFRSNPAVKASMWIIAGLVGYCAWRWAFSPPNNCLGKISHVRKQNLGAYGAIQQGLIKTKFPSEGEKKAYDSPIEWCIGEKGSVTDAVLYAVVYKKCGFESERVEHLSHACAYVKIKEQFQQLLRLGAEITAANVDKILLKAIKGWNEGALNLIADHYATKNPDQKFISEAVIKALIQLRRYNESQALLLAKSLFYGDSDRTHLVKPIDSSLLASYNQLLVSANKTGSTSV
ncbi:MAG: hypothetical protein KDK50_03865 [Chlamydiia bacterium]|nr:hypothetical protein [Chlamydiia bacterium]